MTAQAPVASADAFDASRALFTALLGFIEGEGSGALSHADLERRLQVDGRELLRQLFQDHLDLRADREQRILVVTGADGRPRGAVEYGHQRVLGSVFGELTVGRIAYRARGMANLHPADAALNLPVERHSHGLRELAAVESSRGSFDEAVAAIGRATGQELGKRQVEELASRAAVDFHAFYAQRERVPTQAGDVLVLSCDGKGVVMRHDALRAATAKAAQTSSGKLATRSATASGWPRSARSTTQHRRPVRLRTSCPPVTPSAPTRRPARSLRTSG